MTPNQTQPDEQRRRNRWLLIVLILLILACLCVVFGPGKSLICGPEGGPLPVAGEPGLYVVREDGEDLGGYAVRFDDAGESDLSTCAALALEAIEGGSSESGAFDDVSPPWLWPLLLAVVTLAALGNWWIVTRGA